MCKAGDKFNLSYESITSQEAQVLLHDIQKNNPDLWSTITSTQYPIPVATDTEADSDETETEGEVEDDVEVPVDIVLEWMASDGKKFHRGTRLALMAH
jgi:hypothetical protein